eukprot:bmy_01378T0
MSNWISCELGDFFFSKGAHLQPLISFIYTILSPSSFFFWGKRCFDSIMLLKLSLLIDSANDVFLIFDDAWRFSGGRQFHGVPDLSLPPFVLEIKLGCDRDGKRGIWIERECENNPEAPHWGKITNPESVQERDLVSLLLSALQTYIAGPLHLYKEMSVLLNLMSNVVQLVSLFCECRSGYTSLFKSTVNLTSSGSFFSGWLITNRAKHLGFSMIFSCTVFIWLSESDKTGVNKSKGPKRVVAKFSSDSAFFSIQFFVCFDGSFSNGSEFKIEQDTECNTLCVKSKASVDKSKTSGIAADLETKRSTESENCGKVTCKFSESSSLLRFPPDGKPHSVVVFKSLSSDEFPASGAGISRPVGAVMSSSGLLIFWSSLASRGPTWRPVCKAICVKHVRCCISCSCVKRSSAGSGSASSFSGYTSNLRFQPSSRTASGEASFSPLTSSCNLAASGSIRLWRDPRATSGAFRGFHTMGHHVLLFQLKLASSVTLEMSKLTSEDSRTISRKSSFSWVFPFGKHLCISDLLVGNFSPLKNLDSEEHFVPEKNLVLRQKCPFSQNVDSESRALETLSTDRKVSTRVKISLWNFKSPLAFSYMRIFNHSAHLSPVHLKHQLLVCPVDFWMIVYGGCTSEVSWFALAFLFPTTPDRDSTSPLMSSFQSPRFWMPHNTKRRYAHLITTCNALPEKCPVLPSALSSAAVIALGLRKGSVSRVPLRQSTVMLKTQGVERFNIKELSSSLDLLGLDDTESLISIPRIALIRTEKEQICLNVEMINQTYSLVIRNSQDSDINPSFSTILEVVKTILVKESFERGEPRNCAWGPWFEDPAVRSQETSLQASNGREAVPSDVTRGGSQRSTFSAGALHRGAALRIHAQRRSFRCHLLHISKTLFTSRCTTVRPPATVRASGATRQTAKRLHGVTPTRPRPSRLPSGRAPGVRRGSVSAAKAADATSQPRGGCGASSHGVACPRRDRFHAHEATAITPDAGGCHPSRNRPREKRLRLIPRAEAGRWKSRGWTPALRVQVLRGAGGRSITWPRQHRAVREPTLPELGTQRRPTTVRFRPPAPGPRRASPLGGRRCPARGTQAGAARLSPPAPSPHAVSRPAGRPAGAPAAAARETEPTPNASQSRPTAPEGRRPRARDASGGAAGSPRGPRKPSPIWRPQPPPPPRLPGTGKWSGAPNRPHSLQGANFHTRRDRLAAPASASRYGARARRPRPTHERASRRAGHAGSGMKTVASLVIQSKVVTTTQPTFSLCSTEKKLRRVFRAPLFEGKPNNRASERRLTFGHWLPISKGPLLSLRFSDMTRMRTFQIVRYALITMPKWVFLVPGNPSKENQAIDSTDS